MAKQGNRDRLNHSEIGYHGGKVKVARGIVRALSSIV